MIFKEKFSDLIFVYENMNFEENFRYDFYI